MNPQYEPSNGFAIGHIGLRALLLAVACLSALACASSLAFAQGPSNGRIAFERDGEIFSMNADGGEVRQLTAGPGSRYNPAFSPDGQTIAFELTDQGCGQVIAVMNADGSGQSNLTDYDPGECEYDAEPGWSSDGQKISFTSNRDGNDLEIFVMHADGSGATQVTDNADHDYGSSFSPDGTRIAFSGLGQGGVYALHTIGVDGQGPQQITSPAADHSDYEPVWSPDGQEIAFNAYDENGSEIAKVDADGSNRASLTQAEGYERQPHWSPDGVKLAYTSATEAEKIHTMDADGSNDTPLENGRGPSWGTSTAVPDGVPALSLDDVTVTEGTAFDGSTTPAEFTVSLSRASDAPVTVGYQTESDYGEGDGEATASSESANYDDFEATDGELTFGPGETEKKVVVSVARDDFDEPDETFKLRLHSESGAGIADDWATATIVDDDEPRPEVAIDDVSVDEGTADDGSTTPATFKVSLDAPAPHPMRAHLYTGEGSAREGSDYAGRDEQVIFAPGESEKHVTVDVVRDSRPEPDQNFDLRLGWAESDGGASGKATIVDDEKATIGDVSVDEGTATDGSTTPATFTVSLAHSQSQPIAAHVRTADGSARAGGDYAALSEDVVFAPGETEKQFTVAVARDDRHESNEKFSLLLEVPDEDAPVASGTATITDDDESTAPVGLANPSFEQGLDGWQASRLPNGSGDKEDAACEVPQGVCVVGTDAFTDSDSGTPWTVTPLDGDNMARLGGPFTSAQQGQQLDRYLLEQTFKVDPANPQLDLNYNVFAYDYSGYDELRIKVSLFDEDGDLIAREVQGAYGQGTALKNTGWQDASIDLSGYEGEQVHLKIDSGGTQDNLFGFWAYVDAGDVPEPVVDGGNADASAPPLPDGSPVNLSEFPGGPGQTWFTVPAGQAAQFPGGCMPFTLSVPINAGAGTVSNVQLRLHSSGGGGTAVPMSESNGVWTATIPCAQTGQLFVEYDFTEGGVTQHFVVPIGGLALIDPQGVVYDKEAYDAAIDAGKTPEQARAESAIPGASVRLQRKVGDEFVNVLSGDPGITPNVNPEITGANGLFQWDVSEGTYRVVVTKDGYEPVTSPAVDIPPPVLDLHIAMEKLKVDQTPPVTSHSVSPQPNAAGWHKDDATVTLTAADEQDGSGVKEIVWSAAGAGASAGQTVAGATATVPATAEGETTITYRARDNAGNLSDEKSVTVKLDKTSPAMDCADADGQWHAGNVSIGCSAQDSGSGLGSGDQSFSLATSVDAGEESSNAATGSREICDSAGNCATAGPVAGNKVDRKSPGATIARPKGTLKLRQVVRAAFSCLDSGSGIASCVGGVANGGAVNTKSIGDKTFSVSAGDKVGNRSTVSSSYKVIYDFRGFFKPLANPPRLNTVNVADKSVPLRFGLNGNQGLKVLAAGYPQSRQVNCKTKGALPGKKWTGSSPRALKYDRRQRRYTYNWSIAKGWTSTCRQFALKLKDGTVHQANFKFSAPK